MSASTTTKDSIGRNNYENLMRMIGEFFGYAKWLAYSDAEIFVPGLNWNQSSLEGSFSRARGMNIDQRNIYGGGILQQNVSTSLAADNKKAKYSSYPATMIRYEINSSNCTEKRIGKNNVHFRALINKIIQQVHLSNHHSNETHFPTNRI